jgi:EAL domain-containing protein (putative c-di-GMP-specific phosphodiesterase class I)
VAAVLAAADADPQLLTLEVTESVFVRDGEGALGVLNDLKDIGVMLAIDDFGTGYSALSYLKRLPIDILKIDGEFVKDLGNDLASSAIVGAVVRLAHRLGMRVVAEGVETAAQHREVTELGCDFSQGYYFARPMTSVTFETLIHDFPDEDNQLLPLPLPAGVS